MIRPTKLILYSDINIAPFLIDNPFFQAKLALKFFESGLLKIQTIATAIESFKFVITNGEDVVWQIIIMNGNRT